MATTLTLERPAPAPAASERPPLRIDVHVHLGGIGTSGSGITVSPRFRRSLVFHVFAHAMGLRRADLPRADDLYVERLAARVREASSIDRAVVLALDGAYRDGRIDRDRSPLVVPNDWALRAARLHGDALLFGASVNPERPDALDELERVAAEGAVLLKWLPNVMRFDTGDARHVPFYRRLAALGLPLLTHCGHEYSLPGGRHDLGDPLRLRRALDEGVTVIAAHCATACRVTWDDGARIPGREALARLVARYPLLHADLAALTTLVRGWELRKILDDPRLRPRLVDATDHPVPPMVLTQVGRVPLADLVRARRIANPFDRDRALKRAAGVTDEMTLRAAGLLRLPRLED